MECFTLASGVQATKKLNCCRFRCGGESKHGDVCLFPVTANLVGNQIFNIRFTNFNLAGAERHGYRRHVLTGCGGMGFVDDDGETFTFQSCNAVDDVRELLNRSSCGGYITALSKHLLGNARGVFMLFKPGHTALHPP